MFPTEKTLRVSYNFTMGRTGYATRCLPSLPACSARNHSGFRSANEDSKRKSYIGGMKMKLRRINGQENKGILGRGRCQGAQLRSGGKIFGIVRQGTGGEGGEGLRV